jgi:hypothetical protein
MDNVIWTLIKKHGHIVVISLYFYTELQTVKGYLHDCYMSKMESFNQGGKATDLPSAFKQVFAIIPDRKDDEDEDC